MSVSDQIRSNLPLLRRYARALTGSQDRGDGYVAQAVETFFGEGDRSGSDTESKTALYRTFTRLWREADQAGTADEKSLPVDRRLGAIASEARQAFLLSALENFSNSDIAAILEVEAAEAERLVEAAEREISEQISTTVLIIEDDTLIAKDIKRLAEDLGHNVTAIARTRLEAVEAAKQHEPGIVLADIHLADNSSGIDAVNDILDSIEVPVIFITAFPERMLTGTRPEPVYLITKPFSADMVKAQISQALFFEENAVRK